MPTYRRDPNEPHVIDIEGIEDEPYYPLPWRSFIAGCITAVVVIIPLAWGLGLI